jgi:hypothetical protein
LALGLLPLKRLHPREQGMGASPTPTCSRLRQDLRRFSGMRHTVRSAVAYLCFGDAVSGVTSLSAIFLTHVTTPLARSVFSQWSPGGSNGSFSSPPPTPGCAPSSMRRRGATTCTCATPSKGQPAQRARPLALVLRGIDGDRLGPVRDPGPALPIHVTEPHAAGRRLILLGPDRIAPVNSAAVASVGPGGID